MLSQSDRAKALKAAKKDRNIRREKAQSELSLEAYASFEAALSKESLEYHYEHLAKGYAKRYNAGEGNADFNRAGSFLHDEFLTSEEKWATQLDRPLCIIPP